MLRVLPFFYLFFSLLPAISFATLQGSWNVTEVTTVKTTGNKLTQIQAQHNLTTFNFNTDHSFTRTNQNGLLNSGTYKESTKSPAFTVAIKNATYSQADNLNSIKSRIQANLAARGITLLKFTAKTGRFSGQVYNEAVLGDPIAEDAQIIQGKFNYVVTLLVFDISSVKRRYTITLNVQSVYSGTRNATDTSSSPWAIANKLRLWPTL